MSASCYGHQHILPVVCSNSVMIYSLLISNRANCVLLQGIVIYYAKYIGASSWQVPQMFTYIYRWCVPGDGFQRLDNRSITLIQNHHLILKHNIPQIARFTGPTWGPPGADRTKVGPMLAPWTFLSGTTCKNRSPPWKLIWEACQM